MMLGQAPIRAKVPNPKKTKWTSDDTDLTLLAVPTFIWYALFCFLPMFGIIIAFKRYAIKAGQSFLANVLTSKWAGLDYFRSLFRVPIIHTIIRNTVLYNIVFIITGIVVPVLLAMMISQLRQKRAAKLYQTLLFMPYFLSWVVVSSLVWIFLSFEYGFVNGVIKGMGGLPQNWYINRKFWPGFLVGVNLWKSLGYSMVVYLAAITGIDGSLYEAAVIDGAKKFQQARFITLPLLKTVIILMFIMACGRMFYSDFGLFYTVPRDILPIRDQVMTIDVYVYQQLRQNQSPSPVAAAAALQSMMSCIMILLANFIVSKVDPESSMI